MSVRRARRAVALAATLASCLMRFWLARLHGPLTLERRALWVQASSRRILRTLGIRCRTAGTPPASGLVVSNHLSYLDILILSAPMPCFFVSKAEVDKWPFFGRAARSGGTIFIDRSSVASAELVSAEIHSRLGLRVPLLFFPEGTSTDGSRVLRFHSRLFQPAVDARSPVTAVCIRYAAEGERPEHELCWYGDESFLPNLWRVLGYGEFTAEVCFGESRVYEDRRSAAQETHGAIVGMRHSPAESCALF